MISGDVYVCWGKRLVDIVICVPICLVVIPLLFVVAILIKLDSPGPVLFVQRRLGYKTSQFRLYKLRTMTNKERAVDKEIFGRNADVTKIGYWLRRFKIDELPQIFNVLKGDMSIVGPRPCVPQQTKSFTEAAYIRFEAKPGLTGLAQISGNIYLSWPQRWKLDAEYVGSISLMSDLRIIGKTFEVVLFGEKKT